MILFLFQYIFSYLNVIYVLFNKIQNINIYIYIYKIKNKYY